MTKSTGEEQDASNHSVNHVVQVRSAILLLCMSAVFATGCKPDAAVKKGEAFDRSAQAPAVPTATAPPANAGEVKGTVLFNGRPPARVPIDMSMDPGCSTAGANMTEQYVVEKGNLANVFVYIKSGAPATVAPIGMFPVVLDQKGCRYTPHVIAVQQGGTVEFRNSDPTMHNIHTVPANGTNTVDVSQGPLGQAQIEHFNSPEMMMPVRCNNHPWMNAFINVAPNSYFDVTRSDGAFEIRGLPPGHYTLAAVHEKLGEQDIDINIGPHGTAKADFKFAVK